MLKKSFFSTIKVVFLQEIDNGIFSVIQKQLLKLLEFIIMLNIWIGLGDTTKDFGMSVNQLLTYSLMAAVWHQQMNVLSPATSCLWEGSVIGRYTRPMHIFSSFTAETIGKWWIPPFLFFALPLWISSPLLGVSPLPASFSSGIYALVSILLAGSLGFALDFVFASVAINLKNACWAATNIREAIWSLLSGALIPYAIMPAGIARFLSFLPFGSLSNASLSIYIGLGEPIKLILIQIFWNIVIWPFAIFCYKKSEETC